MPEPSKGCNVTKGAGGMDKDFFVEELQTHHAMLYRVAYTICK